MPVYKNEVVWKTEHLGHTSCGNGTEMDFSAPRHCMAIPI